MLNHPIYEQLAKTNINYRWCDGDDATNMKI